MAFGNSVTDFVKIEGNSGYIIKVDITGLLYDKINKVQAQSSPTNTPVPVISESTLSDLQSNLNEVACPDLAFNSSGSEINIFFSTAIFPYVSTTRFALFGLRNAQIALVDTDNLDVPNRDVRLVSLYALETLYIASKGTATRDINNGIDAEEKRIRDEG